jgi:hypothetical protein
LLSLTCSSMMFLFALMTGGQLRIIECQQRNTFFTTSARFSLTAGCRGTRPL